VHKDIYGGGNRRVTCFWVKLEERNKIGKRDEEIRMEGWRNGGRQGERTEEDQMLLLSVINPLYLAEPTETKLLSKQTKLLRNGIRLITGFFYRQR
jgi:hypothetical protein